MQSCEKREVELVKFAPDCYVSWRVEVGLAIFVSGAIIRHVTSEMKIFEEFEKAVASPSLTPRRFVPKVHIQL